MGSGSGAISSEGVNDFHFFGSPHKLLSPGAGTFVLLARGPVFRRSSMQLWESELVYVPKCLHCHGRPRMHRHGTCRRTGSDGLPTMLQRYRCPRCLRTCSILKDGMLPYRRVSAEQLQSCLDNPQHSQAKTESHKLLKPVLSVAKRFHERTRWLVMLMGPGLLRLPLGLTPGELSQRLWEALRRHYGDAATILRVLASSFRTSLLHDYRCLIRPTPRF
jgi:transposase-like protein